MGTMSTPQIELTIKENLTNKHTKSIWADFQIQTNLSFSPQGHIIGHWQTWDWVNGRLWHQVDCRSNKKFLLV